MCLKAPQEKRNAEEPNKKVCGPEGIRKPEKDLPIEKELGQFEELVAHFNTGWPMLSLNHLETLLQMGS